MIKPIYALLAFSNIFSGAALLPARLPYETTFPLKFRQTLQRTVNVDKQNDLPATPGISGILRRILRDDEQNDPPSISRGPFCLVTPSKMGMHERIWHERPTFIWQGSIGQFEILDTKTNTLLWQYTPDEEEIFAIYDGKPLRSGNRYQWLVYDRTNLESPVMFSFFEILPSVSRQLIGNGLAVAEHQTDGSEEAIAIARANYFANRDLHTDAIQSLFSVTEGSLELQETQTKIIEALCE